MDARPTRPAHVQTNGLSSSAPIAHAPISALSASSVGSNSRQGSPIISIQASPEPIRGRELDDQLPDNNSLPHSFTSSPSITEPLPSKGGLMRRLSNRATRSFARRRPRDGSVGPGILRRRSDSNNTAPPEYPLIMGTDSEDDSVDEFDELRSIGLDVSSGSATGPVIPFQLVKGTPLRKVTKIKGGVKRISWDKSRPHKTLYIDDIKEIRNGLTEQDESRWFSIWYSKMMHLIADDATSFHYWHRQDLMASLMAFNERAITAYWRSEMSRHPDEEDLDFAGVQEVCRKLHIHATPAHLRAKFHEADATKTGRLNFNEDDIREVYQRATATPETGLTRDEFLHFLRDAQCEDVDADLPAWEAAIKSTVAGQPDIIGIDEAAFADYLTSNANMALIAAPKEYTLDRPLNEYFISSSHNTYLLGRQVAGLSTIEGYIAALVRGCRCVEVDCWDGADGQPTVNHGRTLTSSISFKEAIVTINKYAFQKSPYPLWISLEVHCSPPQQEIMTAIIKETFGARLITAPLDPTSDKLPSPEELKGRVVIKVKKPQMKDDYSAGRRRGNSLTSPYIKPVVADNAAVPSQSLPQSPLLSPSNSTRRLVSKSRVNTITEGEVQETLSSSTSDNESSGERGQARKSSNKTTKVLGALGVYCAGVKFSGFDTPDAKAYNHIFSFMESSFEKHSRSKESKKAMDRHNMRYLMRVYPDRYRYNSTNFDPLQYWRRGVQMAALNWQTYDLGMQLNQAMFEGGTDQSGYVLKPSELREIQVMPGGWSGKRERKEVSFTIDVISAQQLMRPANMPANRTVDPYIEVEVFHSNDKRDKKESGSKLPPITDSPLKFCTRVRSENGFNPIFDSRFNFKVTTKYPDLVFVRFSVKMSPNGEAYSDKAQPVATYTAKLSALKQGYRTLPLFDHNGDQYLFSTLFCNIRKDPINSVLLECADDQPDTSGKLRGLGRTIFNRSNNISPKSSMEKTSFDSS
ncbi:phosphatidylinositol-specific phospholipase C [Plectosphaerella plurivora]|uniref:Phosphoinositide phospholipase C n=1 Tax=Plectosphaerella plurivora TaxID=936078 RepID=A0A9P9A8M2_9PEZI|nr:phosphatidylinositol-specific phospholipase C [Plectosphaerella plurivora]